MTYAEDKFPDLHEATVYDNYECTAYKGRVEIVMHIWDTAGHDDLARMRPIMYNGTDCFLFCFSLADKGSLKNLREKWIPEVLATSKSCPCILVGTKLDMREAME